MNWLLILITVVFVVNFPKAALFLVGAIFVFVLIGMTALLTAPSGRVGKR